jgi:hypothetical protein
MLREFSRVCKVGGRMLLLTLAKNLMVKAIEGRKEIQLVRIDDVYVGGFEVGLYHLEKIK